MVGSSLPVAAGGGAAGTAREGGGMFGRVAALAVGVGLIPLAGSASAQPAARLLPPVAVTPLARGSTPADDRPPPRSAQTASAPTDPDDRREPAARLSLPTEITAVAADAIEASRQAVPPAVQKVETFDLFGYLTDGRRARKVDPADRDGDRDPDRARDRDGDRRDPPRDRSSWAFGDRVKDALDLDKPRKWFTSDHAFDCFVSPVTNPFLFEDPRSVTELRPIFIYQKVPSAQPNFSGGNLWFVGTQARIAFTDRFSLTINKFGATAVNPGGGSIYDDKFGFSEIWLGPKYTFVRDEDSGLLVAGGGIFQLPVGSAAAFQDTGSLSITPYVTAAYPFLKSRMGTFTGLGTAGYSFGTNRQRSDYFYTSAHVDFDVGNAHRFFPLMELNWFQYTTNGQARMIAGEGRDLINFGGDAKGSNLLTGALGARVKVTKATEFGGAFEVPLVGNRDFFRYRFTVDFIWRY